MRLRSGILAPWRRSGSLVALGGPLSIAIVLVLLGGGVAVGERLEDLREAPPPGRLMAPRAVVTPPPTAPAPAPSSPPGRPVAAPPAGVYAADGVGAFAPAAAGIPPRVYVPNTRSGTVDVIDPRTARVVRSIFVGGEPHHITPSWDLRTLYVDNPGSGVLTALDPRTQRVKGTIDVGAPYNLYFTPDGTQAMVVAEAHRLIEFRDPHTWKLRASVSIPWAGVDHMDFSADGRYALASCEYTGVVAKVDVVRHRVAGIIAVGGKPVDVKVAPSGRLFYVANQGLGGVSVIDPVKMRQIGWLPTGAGAHGMAVSRDAKLLYVSNRLAGTISVIRFASRSIVATWNVGGSPDMLQVSPDGTRLWTANRFSNTVNVISTETGKVVRSIVVGSAPHGLSYFPQPGRFSIGHNGVYR